MAHGTAVFEKVCASCHGDGAHGRQSVALVDNRRLRALSRDEIDGIIRNGMPNGMPPFGSLPEADLQAVTDFVRSFNSSASIFSLPETSRPASRCSSEKGSAASCHIARGRGAAGGPDLSNIGRQMTLPELTRALVEPDAAIAQGYATARARVEGRPHAARIRSQRRQSRAAASDGRWPSRRRRQAIGGDHARNRIGDAAAESDAGRDARSDRVPEPPRRTNSVGATLPRLAHQGAAQSRRLRAAQRTSTRF